MPDQSSARKLVPIDSELYSQYRGVNRWAVIVGISKYQYSNLNLKYADRDAEDLYQLLLTPNGGSFQADHICKLTNEQATTGNINRALRSFLKKPAREDLVLIYFACHGSPDPDRPNNIYFLTHDTDRNDIAGTALPMEDIDRALKSILHSEKVIILADTCHSAGVSGGIGGRRSVVDDSQLMNRFLQEISRSKGGVALLTSAEANEVSFEDTEWGGGHGVFTHYLLEGMRGAADRDGNGIVTIGELFEYVRDSVKQATGDKQHPLMGPNAYDRNMPISIISGSNIPQTAKFNQYQHQNSQYLSQNRTSVLVDDLSSACGVDYRTLQKFLITKNWQEADEETNKLIGKIINQNRIGIKGIPCQDLWTVDQLWMKYSNNNFSLNKQHQIWQSLVEIEDRRWKGLFAQLGWMSEVKREFAGFSLGNQYLEMDNTIFYQKDIINAQPAGYLPSIAKFVASKYSSDSEKGRQITYLFSRLSECSFNK
ncbi:GUN4 domain-containing protein [Leptolyngbya sp. ST-U4]|uniref:GUN4 domain-containing protein n=1 Tax=Leptolyngbya sp. ST-U4 TaxID=2933912 RepID=UPI00329814BD